LKLFLLTLISALVLPMASGHMLTYTPEVPLRIITIGHPTLRAIAQEVPFEEILTSPFQNFLHDMVDTMRNSGGVGLAAPQVDVSKRVFVMESGASVPLTVVINPKVEYRPEFGKKRSTEGCLSIPGKRATVQRYKRIHLSYFNQNGEQISEEATGFKAVIAQHEYDHLNGVLIVDVMDLATDNDTEDYVTVPLF